MNPLLEQLFQGEYSFIDRKPSEPLKKLLHEYGVQMQQVENCQGEAFADRLRDIAIDLSIQEQKDAFQEGFLLGGQLVMALYR